MRARVRTDGGGLPEWFDHTQGLRRGCVLPPRIFSVFLAAAIHAVVVVVVVVVVVLTLTRIIKSVVTGQAHSLWSGEWI